MFATIRTKLIGFSIASLLFIGLVGGAGYYGYLSVNSAYLDTRENFMLNEKQLDAEVAQNAIRADLLIILRASKSGDTAAFDAAQKALNTLLNELAHQSIKSETLTAAAEEVRLAYTAVRSAEEAYTNSARNIAALAMSNADVAEVQFDVLNKQ